MVHIKIFPNATPQRQPIIIDSVMPIFFSSPGSLTSGLSTLTILMLDFKKNKTLFFTFNSHQMDSRRHCPLWLLHCKDRHLQSQNFLRDHFQMVQFQFEITRSFLNYIRLFVFYLYKNHSNF